MFEGWYTQWLEGDKSPAEVAAELGAVYEGLIANIPQVRQFYASQYGLELSDQAIFVSVLDADIATAILNRRISVAQVGGEGLARGFDVDASFAEKLVAGGVDQSIARGFFSDAEGRLNTLDTLVQRHRDPDDTFDLLEFADATIFGDAVQNRRVQRALRAEAALFSDQTGSLAMNQELALTGLTAR
jgi:hypothetical protein